MKNIAKLILIFSVLTGSAFAQNVLETTVGGGMVLEVEGGIARVALADETIATVTVLNASEVLIHGRANGRTTLFVWTDAGQRTSHSLRVNRDLQALNSAISAIEGEIVIEESSDSRTLLLKGSVATKEDSETAGKRILEVLQTLPEPRPSLVNLLTYPDVADPRLAVDDGLLAALHAIDDRIILRRIRVADGAADDAKDRDSYVLDGRVLNIRALAKAMYVPDRQLGGTGGRTQAADETKIRSNRRTDFGGSIGGGSNGGSGNVLSGNEFIPNGLATQVARGLVLASESGRVISFLEVDNLEQILVSIRVLEIDRKKARTAGINYRVDTDKFSIGSLNAPLGTIFPGIGGTDNLSGLAGQGGNLIGTYVSKTVSLMAAIDLLEQEAVARSVAEPNILTMTGEEATVLVGGEVPIPTTAVGNISTVQGFSFQSFGVRLDIRPTISEQGIVTLEVAPSIVRPNLGLGNNDVPGFEVQTVQTAARVPAGGSLIIGGLLTFEEGMEERGVPLLSRIPILGNLFKWKKRIREEKELLFVITPRLIDEMVPQDIPELPKLESRDHSISVQLRPQQLLDDGVPEVWRYPEPDFPPNVCELVTLPDEAPPEEAEPEIAAPEEAVEEAVEVEAEPVVPEEPVPAEIDNVDEAPAPSGVKQSAPIEEPAAINTLTVVPEPVPEPAPAIVAIPDLTTDTPSPAVVLDLSAPVKAKHLSSIEEVEIVEPEPAVSVIDEVPEVLDFGDTIPNPWPFDVGTGEFIYKINLKWKKLSFRRFIASAPEPVSLTGLSKQNVE